MERLVGSGHDWNFVRDGQRASGGLAAHCRDRLGWRSDPHQTRITHRASEPFTFGKESVSRMYGLGTS